jgi:hypothetical protein
VNATGTVTDDDRRVPLAAGTPVPIGTIRDLDPVNPAAPIRYTVRFRSPAGVLSYPVPVVVNKAD